MQKLFGEIEEIVYNNVMKKLGRIILIALFIVSTSFGMCFLGSNYAPVTLNGGGGANSLFAPESNKNDADSLKDGVKKVVTYKPYEDYFIDFKMPQTLEGNGSQSNPYQIYTTEDFLLLSTINFAGKFVNINCDIILNDEIFDANGEVISGDGNVYVWKPITLGRLATIFGNNHTIKGLYVNEPAQDYIGLFGMRDSNYGLDLKRVDGLNIENVYLNGNKRVYGIAESVNNLSNCKVLSGTLIGYQSVAGLTVNVSESLASCVNYANIKSENSGYGVTNVVYANCKVIKNCKNYGNLDVNAGSGIAGTVKCQRVEACENYGNIVSKGAYCGGIIGITDFYTEIINCKNYGNINNTYMAFGGILACASTSVTMFNCENYGNIYGKTSASGQLIGWLRSVRSNEAIFVFDECKGVMDCASPMLGNVSSSDSGLNIVIRMTNCRVDCIEKSLLQCVLIQSSNGVVDLEIKNIFAESNVSSGKMNLFGNFSDATKAKLKNIILNLHSNIEGSVQTLIVNIKGNSKVDVDGILILNKGKNSFYGNDFSGFYLDYKIGKIGLKAFSGKGNFQGKVTEEILNAKGFEKKEV